MENILTEDRIGKIYNNPNVVCIESTLYTIGPESEYIKNKKYCGFCGRHFIILKSNIEIIDTHNLWCGLDIPDSLKDKFKDNAIFIGAKKIKSRTGFYWIDSDGT